MRRFPTQKQMFAVADDEPNAQHVYASCDKPKQKGKKFFALFSSYKDFAQTIASLPDSDRCFYEMIREDHPCNLYLDIEFVGPPEPEHGTVRVLLQQLDQKLRALPCVPERETLGLAWKDCGATMPDGARLIQHSELERLLGIRSMLTASDLAGLRGVHVEPGHVVEVQGRFLQARA